MARVALARRDLLLRVHRHRLRPEDLEDCYSQATLELLTRARSGARLESDVHIAHALEQKLLSRILDRTRALAGRSPIVAALGRAVSLSDPDAGIPDVADRAAAVHERVAQRMDLARVREVAEDLTPDQRLVLASQVGLDIVVAGLRLDTSHRGTDVGPNRDQDGPRWRILDHVPGWAAWSVRHPPGL